MTCPNCGSDQWKSASLVHKEGVSTSEFTSIGIPAGKIIGVGSASTSGTQQTELSKLTTPPATFVKTTGCLIGFLVSGLFGLVESWLWWLTALFVIGVIVFYRSETKEDDILSVRYKNTRMCARCGTFYVQSGTS